jgi:serine/threonine-protein kinase
MSAQDRVRAGDSLGSYELLSRVGRGGMATVWAARRHGVHGFSKIVAVKTMLSELGDDADFQRMFLAEARVAARIRHPNVVETIDLGEEGGTLYLAMEWVDGETLSSIMKAAFAASGVPLPIALKLIIEACAGVHAAHELRDDEDRLLGVVHRDVSPPNILVSYDGIVKLADFGVAKSMESNNALTLAGQVKGKLRYMAPEQLRSEPIDRRTDVFALGINLYQLTAGRHPWPGDTAAVTMQRILSQDPAPPSDLVEGYPADLERIVLKALHRDPAERFATAAEMALALEEFAARTCGLASAREVAIYVQELLGSRRAARRDALRKAVRDLDAQGARSSAIQLRRIDDGWDDEPAPPLETAVPEPSRLLSHRWQQLASLSRSSRSRRTLMLVGTLLLMTTAYALGARRAPDEPVAETPHHVAAAKAVVEAAAIDTTPSAPTTSHPNAAATPAAAPRKDVAPRPAPMPVRHAAPPPHPTATAESDPDVGF